MAVLCPSCGLEPDGGTSGARCSACGAKLVVVEPAPDPLIGAIIDDRFEILGRVGKGGMGTVYRAKQRSIGREVALKVIDREAEADVASVKRFFREAQLASQLSHPNTVSVIEFGQNSDGRLYLAMELVRGRTLHEIVRVEGALPLWRVVRIGAQLCDAVEAAHALSIIHRDLKLENIMVLEGSRDLVKVLDFGLARSLVDPNSRATTTGVIAGTPRYLPPEVTMHAAEPAPPQDYYALGVILGEIATGRELWRAATIDGLMAMKLESKPNLAGAHPRLKALVERLVAIEPASRPGPADIRAELLAIEDRATPAAGVPIQPNPSGGVPLAATMSPSDLAALSAAVAVKPDLASRAETQPSGENLPPSVALPAGTPPIAGGASPSTSRVANPFASTDPIPLPASVPSLPRAIGDAAPNPLLASRPIRASALVDLDQVGDKPLGDTRVDPHPAGDGAVAPVDIDTGIPSAPSVVLEVDAVWAADRRARQEAAANPAPMPRRPLRFPTGPLVAVVIVLGVAGAGGYYVMTRHPAKPADLDSPIVTGQHLDGGPSSAITIHVTGNLDGDVSIDGKRIGPPPITIQRPRDGKLLMITGQIGDTTVSQQISADHDQIVDLVAPP